MVVIAIVSFSVAFSITSLPTAKATSATTTTATTATTTTAAATATAATAATATATAAAVTSQVFVFKTTASSAFAVFDVGQAAVIEVV